MNQRADLRVGVQREGARRRRGPILAAMLLALGLAVAVGAQVPGGGFRGGFGGNFGGMPRAGWANGTRQRELLPSQRRGFYACWFVFDRFDEGYNFGRGGWGKMGWETDYPLAIRNFMQRLGEFTTTPINMYDDGEMADGVVRATDPALFDCPFLFTSDIGTATLSPAEAQKLREYLLKGGMLWADDFWGREAMDHWLGELRKVLPEYDRVILDKSHPIMSTFYFLDQVPQMPSIQSWERTGHLSYEPRGTDPETPDLSAILDEHGRALIVMSHNTDIGDGMEREGVNQNYFYLYSPKAYALAVNIALYSMTR